MAVLPFSKNPCGTHYRVSVFAIHYQTQSILCKPQAVQGDLTQQWQAPASPVKTYRYMVFALRRLSAFFLSFFLFFLSGVFFSSCCWCNDHNSKNNCWSSKSLLACQLHPHYIYNTYVDFNRKAPGRHVYLQLNLTLHGLLSICLNSSSVFCTAAMSFVISETE